MVAVLYVLGVSSIREFALPLMAGIICGAYSSVCITGALWYVMKTGKKTAAEKAAAAVPAAGTVQDDSSDKEVKTPVTGNSSSKNGKKSSKKKKKHK